MVVYSLPIAAICWLSWQMAPVPESDSGLTALVTKSQSIQKIHGLCACAQLVWDVWSTWTDTQMRASTHMLFFSVEMWTKLRTWNLKIISLTFTQIICLGSYAFPCTSGRRHSHEDLNTEPAAPWHFYKDTQKFRGYSEGDRGLNSQLFFLLSRQKR